MERIEITDKHHLALIWTCIGASNVAEALRKAADKAKVVGMTIAADLAVAKAEEAAVQMKIKNVVLAMRNGLDPDKERLIMETSKGNVFLISELFDLIEESDA
ncbi:MAG: hypothetical protein EPN62_00975 [Candidimonas sp.]|nr:MAG: hypothetical protein EPN77_01975 [Candidimonas sp.]TAM26899.1 MAG: hypothetical protein EPN62_00975 [Candidimonas sp.]